MASFRILYWYEIPSVVEARDDQGGKHKQELSARFQELIDRVAMRRKLAGTDAYLEGWRRGRPAKRDGSAEEVAKAIAAETEATYDQVAAAAKEG